MNKTLFAIIPLLLTLTGCTSSMQLLGGTGTGKTYGQIITVEHFNELFCDTYLVYFQGDMGHMEADNPGSYCIKNNDPMLIHKLEQFAASGDRVIAEYETAYGTICGCDYAAWIISVEKA